MYQVDSSSTMPCRCAGLWQAQHTFTSYPDTLTEGKKKDKETHKKTVQGSYTKMPKEEKLDTQHPAPSTQYHATEIQVTRVPGYANSGTKINYIKRYKLV